MSSYLYLLVHYFDRINIKNQMLEYIIVKSTNREKKREIEWAKENIKLFKPDALLSAYKSSPVKVV